MKERQTSNYERTGTFICILYRSAEWTSIHWHGSHWKKPMWNICCTSSLCDHMKDCQKDVFLIWRCLWPDELNNYLDFIPISRLSSHDVLKKSSNSLPKIERHASIKHVRFEQSISSHELQRRNPLHRKPTTTRETAKMARRPTNKAKVSSDNKGSSVKGSAITKEISQKGQANSSAIDLSKLTPGQIMHLLHEQNKRGKFRYNWQRWTSDWQVIERELRAAKATFQEPTELASSQGSAAKIDEQRARASDDDVKTGKLRLSSIRRQKLTIKVVKKDSKVLLLELPASAASKCKSTLKPFKLNHRSNPSRLQRAPHPHQPPPRNPP